MPPSALPPERLTPGYRAFAWCALGALWLGVVVSGLIVVARYDNTPGRQAVARSRWPASSRLTHNPQRPTLVMVAHPRCTCTQASLTELAELMARTRGALEVYVVFAIPPGLAGATSDTALWDDASAIPQVTLIRDEDGREASAFRAATSGQVFLYGAEGNLLFSGGLTRSRGHAGDNDGRRTILALVNHQSPPRRTTPVFGCALQGPTDTAPRLSGAE